MRDDESFAAFVSARQAPLIRFAFLLTGESFAAQDLVQSALALAVPHLSGRGDAEPATSTVSSESATPHISYVHGVSGPVSIVCDADLQRKRRLDDLDAHHDEGHGQLDQLGVRRGSAVL